jgi:hypothetical protein
MPVPIKAWSTALKAVDTDHSHVEHRRSPNDNKYLFPYPGIFATPNEARRAQYFSMWMSTRQACIFRVFSSSSSALPLSIQEWKDFLIGDIVSKGSASRVNRAQEQARRLIGSALEETDIEINPLPFNSTAPPLEDSEAQKVLWEVTELNFRFELLALDKRASSSEHKDDGRQELITNCFKERSLLIADAEHANAGLGSCDWKEKLSLLLRFRTLMRDWMGMKPTPLLLDDLPSIDDYSENDVLQLEDAIARFYTQSFFRFFGRAATIPARLP